MGEEFSKRIQEEANRLFAIKEELEKKADKKDLRIKSIINTIRANAEEIQFYAENKTMSKNEKIRETQKSKREARKALNKLKQGKLRDLVSSLFFNHLDKRVHNKIYKGDIWFKHEERVEESYKSNKGFFKRLGWSAVHVALPVVASVGLLGLSAWLIPAGIAGYTVVKGAAIKYNKFKYGEPRLEREYDVPKIKGSTLTDKIKNWGKTWINNIKSARKSRNEAKQLFLHASKVHGVNSILNDDTKGVLGVADSAEKASDPSKMVGMGLSEDTRKALGSVDDKAKEPEPPKNTEAGLSEDTRKVLGGADDKAKEPEPPKRIDDGKTNMTYAQALHVLRTKEKVSNEDWNMALHVIDDKLGASKKNIAKFNPEDERLNEYNKIEKLLSIYGRLIKSGKATEQEKKFFNELLYYFTYTQRFDNTFFEGYSKNDKGEVVRDDYTYAEMLADSYDSLSKEEKDRYGEIAKEEKGRKR